MTRRLRRGWSRASAPALACSCVAALAGCASTTQPAPRRAGPAASSISARMAINSYLRQIEPLRLAVNQLLGRADPILDAYHEGRASSAEAASRMGRLERRFAAYTVDVAAVEPTLAQLRRLQAAYAHAYVLEDAYLSSLVAGLASRNLQGLPNTQASQRAAIIAWRTGLTVLARESNVALPADLQQAGRGEIAPGADGS
jgi:hypothetical protein